MFHHLHDHGYSDHIHHLHDHTYNKHTPQLHMFPERWNHEMTNAFDNAREEETQTMLMDVEEHVSFDGDVEEHISFDGDVHVDGEFNDTIIAEPNVQHITQLAGRQLQHFNQNQNIQQDSAHQTNDNNQENINRFRGRQYPPPVDRYSI